MGMVVWLAARGAAFLSGAALALAISAGPAWAAPIFYGPDGTPYPNAKVYFGFGTSTADGTWTVPIPAKVGFSFVEPALVQVLAPSNWNTDALIGCYPTSTTTTSVTGTCEGIGAFIMKDQVMANTLPPISVGAPGINFEVIVPGN